MSSENLNEKKGPKKSKFAQFFSRMNGPPSPPPRPLISKPQPFDQRRLRPGELQTLKEKRRKGKEKKGGNFREAYAAAKIAAEAAVANPAGDRTRSIPHKRHRHRPSTERGQSTREAIRDPPPVARMQFTREFERPSDPRANPQPTGQTIRPPPPVANTGSSREEIRRRPVPPPAATIQPAREEVRRRPVPAPSPTPKPLRFPFERDSGESSYSSSRGDMRREENRQTRWSDFASPKATAPQPALPVHLPHPGPPPNRPLPDPPVRRTPVPAPPVQTVSHSNAQLVHPAHRPSMHSKASQTESSAPHQSMRVIHDRSSTTGPKTIAGTRSWACRLCHAPGAAHPSSGICEPCMLNGRYPSSTDSVSSLPATIRSVSGVSSLSQNDFRPSSTFSTVSSLSQYGPRPPSSVYSRSTNLDSYIPRDSATPPLPTRSHERGFYNPNLANLRGETSVKAVPNKPKPQPKAKERVRDSDASWKTTYKMWQSSEEERSRMGSPVPKYEGIGSGQMGVNNRRSSFYDFYPDLVKTQVSVPNTLRENKGKATKRR